MKQVYRIFDPDARLLYVGLSANPPARIAAHRRWMPDGCRVSLSEPYDDVEAAIQERRAIICEAPHRNVVWNQHRPSSLNDAWLSARQAALYLVGQEPRFEGWAELIVEGYGIEPIEPGTPDRTGWRSMNRCYRLADLEATYRTLRADRQQVA